MKDLPPSTPELREVAPAYATAADELKFPAAPDFNPKPPQLSADDFIRWCEEMMELSSANRGNPQQRLAQKAPLEFSF